MEQQVTKNSTDQNKQQEQHQIDKKFTKQAYYSQNQHSSNDGSLDNQSHQYFTQQYQNDQIKNDKHDQNYKTLQSQYKIKSNLPKFQNMSYSDQVKKGDKTQYQENHDQNSKNNQKILNKQLPIFTDINSNNIQQTKNKCFQSNDLFLNGQILFVNNKMEESDYCPYGKAKENISNEKNIISGIKIQKNAKSKFRQKQIYKQLINDFRQIQILVTDENDEADDGDITDGSKFDAHAPDSIPYYDAIIAISDLFTIIDYLLWVFSCYLAKKNIEQIKYYKLKRQVQMVLISFIPQVISNGILLFIYIKLQYITWLIITIVLQLYLTVYKIKASFIPSNNLLKVLKQIENLGFDVKELEIIQQQFKQNQNRENSVQIQQEQNQQDILDENQISINIDYNAIQVC
ncbi:hypothetical protein PPERSA_04230 [Pseudocohnilembus persalinus]|uniref:Transmembrane protein n=1 Tax=Pseudocohnilembus persalinus TaxID=266149 RepID=A0A0V0QNN2_PSEPJ|nr:hypothetical protein PPERSA_04230 [Pseudocohnilembus persalinus]|eukprot:KRX03722.1 hypothetical protein PPERSA_04230 [Pseudocohnilembus persalinus]